MYLVVLTSPCVLAQASIFNLIDTNTAMKSLSFGLLLLLVQSTTFAQRNSFRYQTGLAHCFFDGTPIVNSANKVIFGESQYLNRSNGFQYQRILDNSSRLQIDILSYNHFYRTYNFENLPALPDSILFPMLTFTARKYVDYQFCFLRHKPINKTLAFQYGIGPAFRYATYKYAPPLTVEPGPGPVVSNYTSSIYPFDIGANVRGEMTYTPVKWLTFFTQVNLVGLFFRFENPFFLTTVPLIPASKPLQMNFPSRFDLSLRFGVGINI